MKKIFIFSICIGSALAQVGCEKALDVVPPSEFAPGNVLTNEAGIRSILFSSYTFLQNQQPSRYVINNSEVTTDMAFNSGGAENLMLSQLINFTWDASLGTLQADVWAPNYRCIRDANIVLDNVASASLSDEKKKLYTAEARFLRAYAYEFLYKWFGPVPLRTSSETPTEMARATDAEMKTFIESELQAAIPDLPLPGKEEAFGRVTRGAALGLLAKYYLNTRQWQKAADAAKQVMDLNYYQLFPRYQDLFRVENEGNKEMMLVIPCRNEVNFGNWFTAGALPPNFKSTPQIPEYTWVQGMANFATQYRLRSAFVNSFDLARDKRAILIVRSYINNNNATVNLMATPDNARSLKYWDNNTIGNHSGNDVPLLRYADMLLTRAEALNELGGPSGEVLDLVNLVRTRAGLSGLTMADAPGRETLRELILKERGHEFYTEGKRREDLLRHDKFISSAQARGIVAAAEKHKLFPIPQSEMDANSLVEQNTGY